MTKVCSSCGEDKSIEEFNFRSKAKNTRQHCCKMCSRVKAKLHYEGNIQYYVDKAAKQIKKAKLKYKEFKKGLCCTVCGEYHVACLEFHHIDPTTKEYNIGHMASQGYSQQRVDEELAKCIVLCSNCHRKLHYDMKEPHAT